ncbi:MAG: YgdI/YgdR family lipoprotein [Verrucomicrobiota bacterium]
MRPPLPLATLAAALAVALLAAGCSFKYYDVTLTNSTRIRTDNKPRLQNGMYVFKDGDGNVVRIPAMRVRSIEGKSKLSKEEPDPFSGPQKR